MKFMRGKGFILNIIYFFLFLCFFILHSNLCCAQYDKDVLYYRGRVALSDGKYSAAIENFNILAYLDTLDYETFFFRGIAKYNLGDLRGAQEDFNTSIRLNSIFTNGYHYRAITHSRFGKYDDALADLEKAISLRPGLEGLYFSRGVTYFLARQFGNAVKDFDKYIRKEPKDPSGYLNRGASYLFLGDTLKALNDYNRAIKLDRFEPEGYVRRGRLNAARKRFDEAIADMGKAISLDTANTYAYFNRAIMYYEAHNYNSAMKDLDRVLKTEPGNALTLYNRSLIHAQVGDYGKALEDIDRVIEINPGNVLAYYNRASYFVNMERWKDALNDYTKAIELYPDFAKAYMNRSYVASKLGMKRASKQDYDTAKRKVEEFSSGKMSGDSAFADTTGKFSSLLALDAEFAKKGFDDELLQYRDIDIRLKPLYKFSISGNASNVNYAFHNRYENALLDKFILDLSVPVVISNSDSLNVDLLHYESVINSKSGSKAEFLKGMYDANERRYLLAKSRYDKALEYKDGNGVEKLYEAFYLINRGALKAEMIDFISSIENNVQTLSMDDKGTTRARVSDRMERSYDYSEALADMEKASEIVSDSPYIYFNLGNLYSSSSKFVEAISNYDKAINLYPYMGDAYYNRGLVLIYLKDKEKGCIDLSRAGALGVKDAYRVISKYCEEEK